MEQRGALQEQSDRIGPGMLCGNGESHGVDVVGHDPGHARREGCDAGRPAPTAQVQNRLPVDPGGLGLHDTGQLLARLPDDRSEGDRRLCRT